MATNPPDNSESKPEFTAPVPSTMITNICTFCPLRPPVKYTCPRCSLQTCSASCSSLHKTQTGCTGERDKAKYVSMKEYGYGALMNDYVYLEGVGRKVKEWGTDIAKGKYQITERDRVGDRRRRKSKKEGLQIQLEIREIHLVLLPPGMEKKKVNQSYWDIRQKKIYLTIEFLFVKGRGETDSIRLITHKNDIDKPLLTILQTHVGDKLKHVAKQQGKSKVNPNSTNAETALEWLKELVFPDPPDQLESFAPPLCLIRSTNSPSSSLPRISLKRLKSRSYHSLDPFQKLSQSLRRKELIEFPLIEVWEKDAFTECGFAETDQQSGVYEKVVEEADRRPRKRRKIMGKKQGEAVVKDLLGGYGSSEDEDGDGDGEEDWRYSPDMLVELGQYEESEGESEAADPAAADDLEGAGSDEEVGDPAVLIQQLESAGFTFDPSALDDDEIDWGGDDL